MTPAAKALRLARGFETIRCSLASTPTGGKIRMAHEVPALPYDYSALEPYIDTQTMHLHHDKHHQAYVTNLNAALEKAPELQKLSAEELLKGLENVPEAIRNAVRNNGGGHVNHTMFWKIMAPERRRRTQRRHRRRHQERLRRFQRLQGEVQRRRPEAVRQRLGVAGARPGRQAAGHELGQPGQSHEPGLLSHHGQ